MRSSCRNFLHIVALCALGAFSAGCSARSATSLTPTPTSQSRSDGSLVTNPISLQAFPISLSAFPISLSAYPAAQGTVALNNTATKACAGFNGRNVVCTVVKRSPAQKIGANTPASSLAGYLPIHLQGAYNVTNAAQAQGAGMTIAIVTANSSAATIDSDLAVYRNTFGLPACTVASGCLKIVNASSDSPNATPAWSEETAIDTEMVSAICPMCSILVVIASSSSIADLSQGVVVAASYHPVAISNSYAVPEASDNVAYAQSYNQPGIAVVAGAGDTGFGVNFPASAPTVIAVGGTSLSQTPDGHFNTQTLWSNTGSGCSRFFAKPSWQTDSGCSMRTINDIAAIADPAFGVAGYSSAGGGWNVYGGTSVAAPIISAIYGLAGQGPHYVSDLYSSRGWAQVAYPGSNGTCLPAYLCSVLQGYKYNAPVGLGVPNGPDQFQSRSSWPTPQQPGPPSLSISTASNAPWTYGQNNAQYTITVVNSGSGPTSGTITVTDTLPAGFSLNGNSFGPGVACTANGAQITCTMTSTINQDSSQKLSIPVALPTAGLGTSVTATASAFGGGDAVHTSAASAVTSSVTTPIGLPSLAISGVANTANGAWMLGQSNAQYTVTITNNGLGPTSGAITVITALPPGLSYNGGNGTVNVGPDFSCSAHGNLLTCTSSKAINAGQSQNLNVPVTVAMGGVGITVTSTESVYGGGDPVYSSQATATVTSTTVAVAQPTLTLSQSANGPWSNGQTGQQYAITVGNTGLTPTYGPVSINIQLPASVTSSGVSGTSNNGFDCKGGPKVTCSSNSPINPNSSVTFYVPTQIATPLLVLQTSNGPWSYGQNNAQYTINVSNIAPSTVSEQATIAAFGGDDAAHNSPKAALTGSVATTINFVPGPTGVPLTVTDNLPDGFTWDGNSPAGFACSIKGNQLACNTSSFTGNQTLNIQGSLAGSGLNGSLMSTASAQYPGQPVAGTNSLATPMLQSLSLSLSANGPWTIGQNNAQYTLTVANVGAGPTSGPITVTDTLPSGFSWNGHNPGAGFNCSASGNQLTCTSSKSVNGNQSQNLNIQGSIGTTTPASITDTATAYGGGDPNHLTSATAVTAGVTTSVTASVTTSGS